MFNAYFIYSSITTNVVECNMKGCNEKRNIMGEVHHGDKRKKHKPISDGWRSERKNKMYHSELDWIGI